jgi:hypothetical protein
MKFITLSLIVLAAILGLSGIAQSQQINPNEDIRWTAATGCATAGLPFVPADQKCETVGNTGTVTQVNSGNADPLFTVAVSLNTTTPTFAFTQENAAQNSVLAGPATGGAGPYSFQTSPTFSAANLTNFPTFNQNTTGTAANITATTNSTLTSLPNLALPYGQLSGTVPTWNQNTTGTAAGLSAQLPISGVGTSGLSGTGPITINAAGAIGCATCSTGTSTAALTGNNSNSGAASGSTYNGGTAVTFSANTFGAGSLANANTWSAANIFSAAGAASTPAIQSTCVPYAGTNANSFGCLDLTSGSAASITTLNTAGTYLTIRQPTGGTADLINVFNGTASMFKVTSGGAVTATGTGFFNNLVLNSAAANITSPSATAATHETQSSLQFAGSSGNSLHVGMGSTSSTAITAGDNYSNLIVGATPVTTPATGTNSWLVNEAIDPIGTVTSGGAAIINTADLYVGAASAAGTNNYSLYVAGPLNAASYGSNTNCSSSASPAVCGSALAGSVLIPTGTTSETLTVNTTAVTANSQIFFYPDDSLGTKLSTTCNSTLATLAGGSFISGRVSGASFTITFNGSILTNGVCGSYFIIN